jgi:predicted GIY-YIG superfamily endonuclease
MLTLPAAIEPFCASAEDFHRSAVYALTLSKPERPGVLWDRQYDHRPPWWQEFVTANAVFYVGATTDLLSRLEDHRDGEVRQAIVLQVCDVADLHTVWFDEAPFESEYNMARLLARQRPEAYVHQR